MQALSRCFWCPGVALRTEGVDRNPLGVQLRDACALVALRTEGVDRNFARMQKTTSASVALRTEGVDRNMVASF